MRLSFLFILLLFGRISYAQVPQGSGTVQDTASHKVQDTTTHKLKEFVIKERMPPVLLKGDTTEFNAGSYKVNPDADAADLVRKMPSIQVSGNKVSAQGETVIKVTVDGRAFFGDDAYAALKNLPADIIDKVQVYNEKSEQEQFTGFSEGKTNKAINIVTKPDKRNGVFGKAYGGLGSSNSPNTLYGAGMDMNDFRNDERITVNANANNTNIQNFTEQSNGGGGDGMTTTHSAGINYGNKWGKQLDLNGSYFFNDVNRSAQVLATRTYTLPADSGQVYKEVNNNSNHNYNHRMNLRLNWTIDTLNSIIFSPQISMQKSYNHSLKDGNTNDRVTALNSIQNDNNGTQTGNSFSGNLLLRHKFRKKGETFSLGLTVNDYKGNNNSLINGQDIYYTSPSLNDTLKQQAIQKQGTYNYSADAVYTLPVGKKGQLKAEYDVTYTPAQSDRGTYKYSDATNSYSVPDSILSSSFNSASTVHKAGSSYLYRVEQYEFSVGANYQFTTLASDSRLPVAFQLAHNFENVLPVAMFRYKFSKAKNLQVNYNASTRPPSVNQLQSVVNNTDPLHLTAGNPSLVQPYSHNLSLRYNATDKDAKTSFNASVTGSYTRNSIATNAIIAERDTLLPQNILLPKGSQLTMPVNAGDNRQCNATVSLGMPLDKIKCKLNIGANATIGNSPSIINNLLNHQDEKSAGINITLGSSISEKIDFTLISNSSVTATSNSLSTQSKTTTYNESGTGTLNLLLAHGFVFNTGLTMQSTYGLSAGYNQTYVVWNMGIGKKLFKKKQGDIRISGFDLLNKNNNIQRTVYDTYIQDSHSSLLQRYFILSFSYKIRNFRS